MIKIGITLTVMQLGKGYVAQNEDGMAFAAGNAKQIAAAVGDRAKEIVKEAFTADKEPKSAGADAAPATDKAADTPFG